MTALEDHKILLLEKKRILETNPILSGEEKEKALATINGMIKEVNKKLLGTK